MADLVQFVVENQEYVWWLLGFFIFIYIARFFYQLTTTVFNLRKTLKLK